MTVIAIVGLLAMVGSFFQRGPAEPGAVGWETLGLVKFRSVWYDPYKAMVKMPVFPDTLKKLDGREVEISGFFIPMELNGRRFALSRNPNSSCFFCGRATIETIVMVSFRSAVPDFKSDDVLTLAGTFRIKAAFNDFIYTLEDARLMRVEK